MSGNDDVVSITNFYDKSNSYPWQTNNRNTACKQQPGQTFTDWEISSVYSWPHYNKICVPVNNGTAPSVFPRFPCPRLQGGLRPLDIRWNKLEDRAMTYASPGREVNCTYKLRDFKTIADLKNWTDHFSIFKFPENKKVYNELIMPYLCFQKELTDCIPPLLIDPKEACKGGLTGCSNMHSNTFARACGEWANANRELSQIKSGGFCSDPDNLCAIDCRCINRASVDKIYDAVAKTEDARADGCWYVPCKNSKNLVNSDVNIFGPTCVDSFCKQVVTVFNKDFGTVNVDIGEQTIACGGLSGNDPGNGGARPPGGDSSSNIVSTWQQYQVYWIIGIVVFLLLIALIIIIVVFSKNKEKIKNPGT